MSVWDFSIVFFLNMCPEEKQAKRQEEIEGLKTAPALAGCCCGTDIWQAWMWQCSRSHNVSNERKPGSSRNSDFTMPFTY